MRSGLPIHVQSAEANLAVIMGDGSAQFLKGLDDRLGKLGPEYMAVVVGSAGYSCGEDKLMGPQAALHDGCRPRRYYVRRRR